ncbi:hypothetical protein MNBD_GAMMA12-440 [hydrothermal vent metagenome]|uniref:PsbP C-terminal domain-containing protein n=1 Tax=hydrothermal vent metagenome TaxID=652676 RepID=A0A3B0YT32_9ZZZZ
MNNRVKVTLLFVVSVLLTACAGSQWKTASNVVIRDSQNQFQIRLPAGWMHQTGNKKSILVSRDGLSLQYIKVGAIREHDLQLMVRAISRDKSKMLVLNALLPSELAGIIVSVFKNRKITRNLKILANRPAVIGSNINGFRLLISFITDSGLQIKREVYGYAEGAKLVFIMYQAPVLHYFSKDLGAFRQVVASFKSL